MRQSPGRAPWFLWTLLVGFAVSSQTGRADTTWHVRVGAQSTDQGRQALAFLPNEIWIHENDSITYHWRADEPHTVTFMTAMQVRPVDFHQGCGGAPPFATSPAKFDGTKCVSAPALMRPGTFTIQFTKAGNYKVVCLLHPDMTGTIHVVKATDPLPHEQPYYDAQAEDQADHLLSEADHDGHHDHGGWMHAAERAITVGDGEVLSNGGGKSTAALMRFTDSSVTVHVGDTVEWENRDPATPHTITFGIEPPDNLLPIPSPDVTRDEDGVRHATLNHPGDSTHSGFIVAAPEEVPLSPTPPPGPTTFRVTFKSAGTYPFICALHDGLGMKGEIIVK
ncbi:MAG TPA: plastocyanin/azurin family copper-binding protein [Vicinamibacterales bacterium]